MDFARYAPLIRRNIAVAVIAAILGLACGMLVTLVQHPIYQSTAKAFIAAQAASNAIDLSAGGTYTQQIAKSYATAATTSLVLDPVINKLGLPVDAAQLSSEVSVTIPTDEAILEIAVSDRSPSRAATIANAITEQLASVVNILTPTSGDNRAAVKITPLETAVPSSQPVSPRPTLNAVVGLVLGLVVGVAISALRETLDTRIRDVRELEYVTAHSVIGATLLSARPDGKALVVLQPDRAIESERYRALRTNLDFLDIRGSSRVITVTSATSGEGKSTTVANLAIVLADAGKKVLLVDADLRRPSVAERLGLDSSIGLTDVLLGRTTLSEAVQRWGNDGLDILPSGTLPPNPSELLQSESMQSLIGQASDGYDIVIFDSPPLLPVTDAAILTHMSDGAIVVAAVRQVKRSQVKAALEALAVADGRVLGIVGTKVRTGGGEGYAYAYEYGQDNTPRDARLRATRLPAARNDVAT